MGQTINQRYEKQINKYFQNDAKELHLLVDRVLRKLKFHDIDVEEFYSLAHEIFYKSLKDYNESQSFDGFMYSCLYKKFCTEMTRKGRKKRKGDKDAISIDAPIGDDDNRTIKDILVDKNTIEKEVFEKNKEGYSKEMIQYLARLSILQQEVLRLISIGFEPSEILAELHINKKQYDDCYAAIHSYRNIEILM